jgi:tellurite resistance protein TerC
VSPELIPWVLLAVTVGGMLALDLLVLHRRAEVVPFRQAALWSTVWVSLALGFGVYVAATQGSTAGGEYLAGYLIELSLSVDNVFVFALVFAAFAVPAAYQHRLLFWGILGAIVFRGIFIAAGTAVLDAAHWVIYLLGVLLVVTGLRLARSKGHAVDPARNPVLRVFRRVVPMTDDYRGAAFVVREGGQLLATPLLAVLLVVETTDVMFAIDSIPAVFAVTTDPFIVFSSNLFAILGLRSLYFLLAGLLDRFVYLKTGLAVLLAFAGVKILVSGFIEIPIGVALLVIIVVLGTAVGASLVATHPRKEELTMPLVRIISGTALGLGALALFVGAAAFRDGQPLLLELEVLLLASIALAVLAAGAALNLRDSGRGMGRVLLVLGTAALFGAGFIGLVD